MLRQPGDGSLELENAVSLQRAEDGHPIMTAGRIQAPARSGLFSRDDALHDIGNVVIQLEALDPVADVRSPGRSVVATAQRPGMSGTATVYAPNSAPLDTIDRILSTRRVWVAAVVLPRSASPCFKALAYGARRSRSLDPAWSYSSVTEEEKHVPPVWVRALNRVSFRAIADFASGPTDNDR